MQAATQTDDWLSIYFQVKHNVHSVIYVYAMQDLFIDMKCTKAVCSK